MTTHPVANYSSYTCICIHYNWQAKYLYQNFKGFKDPFFLHFLPKGSFLQTTRNLSFKKNQFDYERAHTHSSCYLATNKALLVIAVPLLAAKNGQRLLYNHIDF